MLCTHSRYFIYLVLFSEEVLKELSIDTKTDLDVMAKKLGLPSEVTKECKSQDHEEKMQHVWSVWQLSDGVICKGPEASNYCLETMESLSGNHNLIQELKRKLQKAGGMRK